MKAMLPMRLNLSMFLFIFLNCIFMPVVAQVDAVVYGNDLDELAPSEKPISDFRIFRINPLKYADAFRLLDKRDVVQLLDSQVVALLSQQIRSGELVKQESAAARAHASKRKNEAKISVGNRDWMLKAAAKNNEHARYLESVRGEFLPYLVRAKQCRDRGGFDVTINLSNQRLKVIHPCMIAQQFTDLDVPLIIFVETTVRSVEASVSATE